LHGPPPSTPRGALTPRGLLQVHPGSSVVHAPSVRQPHLPKAVRDGAAPGHLCVHDRAADLPSVHPVGASDATPSMAPTPGRMAPDPVPRWVVPVGPQAPGAPVRSGGVAPVAAPPGVDLHGGAARPRGVIVLSGA